MVTQQVKARLVGELRGRIQNHVEERVAATSLRQLAELLGVSHNSLFKLIHGKPMRVSTLRRIAEALGRVEGYQSATRLNLDLENLLVGLGKRRREAVKRRVKKVIAEAFEAEGQEVPRWVNEIGKR